MKRNRLARLTQIEIDHYLTYAHFTRTEREVFLLLCDDETSVAIETDLHIPSATLSRIKNDIYDKIVRVMRYKPRP